MLAAPRRHLGWSRRSRLWYPHAEWVAGYEARGKARYCAAQGSGNDLNSGKRDAPFATVEKTWKSLAGDEIGIVRGGIRTELSPGSGTPYLCHLAGTAPGWTTAARGTLTNAPGEPVELRGSVRINAGWNAAAIRTPTPGMFRINGWRAAGAESTLWFIGNDLLIEGVELGHFDPANPTANTGKFSAIFGGNPGVTTALNPVFRKVRVRDVHWDGVGNQPHGFYVDQVDGCLFELFVVYNIRGAGAADNQYAIQVGPRSANCTIRNGLIYNTDGAITTWTQSAGQASSSDVSRVVFGTTLTSGAVRTFQGAGAGTALCVIANCHSEGTLINAGASSGITNNGGNTTGAVTYLDAANRNFFPMSVVGKGPDWG